MNRLFQYVCEALKKEKDPPVSNAQHLVDTKCALLTAKTALQLMGRSDLVNKIDEVRSELD
jgi:hypothetical protein